MNRIKKALNNQGGFTLIEMLIVVAIIAILIAISIPMVNSSLEKARKATDDANERAAKAAALVDYLSDSPTTFTADNVAHKYNAAAGDFSGTSTGYGKSSGKKNWFVYVTISDNNAVVEWKDS